MTVPSCSAAAASTSLLGCSGSRAGCAVRACPTAWPMSLSAPRPERSSGVRSRPDHLALLSDDMDFFGEFPKLLTDLIPATASNPSQVRARDLAQAARDGSVATIQSIGRGAMAARNPPVRNLELVIDVLSLGRSWPSPKFHATTTDVTAASASFSRNRATF